MSNRAERRKQKKLNKHGPAPVGGAVGAALEQAIAHHQAGRVPQAEQLYRQILSQDPNNPDALHMLGLVALQTGHAEASVDLLQNALKARPVFAQAHFNLANAHFTLNHFPQAIEHYQLAARQNPGDAKIHNNLGMAYQGCGAVDDAIQSFTEALNLNPHDTFALTNLLLALERTNRVDDMRVVLNQAQIDGHDPVLLGIGQALLAKRDKRYVEARPLLEAALKAPNATQIAGELAYVLGDVCDRLGDFDQAFAHFQDANARQHATVGRNFNPAAYQALVDQTRAAFTPDWVANWPEIAITPGRPDPVFLVAFPRSGTTLLDTILRSHPAIAVLEEKPIVMDLIAEMKAFGLPYPDGLAELNADQVEALRASYFRRIETYLDGQTLGPVVIDKLPLNLVEAGFIHRLFPNAKFLFALRHPCDCVLSNYMQNFVLNNAMANFLDLDQAAALYDKAMGLWQHYQEVLPLAVHTVKYEALIEDFKGVIAPTLAFLGLDWDPAVEDYIATAQKRGRINTPSYNQVTQPLYTRARGRWENYRTHLAPILPTLQPWAKRFGYPP